MWRAVLWLQKSPSSHLLFKFALTVVSITRTQKIWCRRSRWSYRKFSAIHHPRHINHRLAAIRVLNSLCRTEPLWDNHFFITRNVTQGKFRCGYDGQNKGQMCVSLFMHVEYQSMDDAASICGFRMVCPSCSVVLQGSLKALNVYLNVNSHYLNICEEDFKRV